MTYNKLSQEIALAVNHHQADQVSLAEEVWQDIADSNLPTTKLQILAQRVVNGYSEWVTDAELGNRIRAFQNELFQHFWTI